MPTSNGPTLPSAIELCLNERLTSARARKLAMDKRFCRDLKDQALYDLAHFPYVDRLDCAEPLDPTEFIVYPSNDLSPLVEDGKCVCDSCKLRYTRAFARGLCLYADVVVLSDHFNATILQTTEDTLWPDSFLTWVHQLRYLEPLMREGVIRFAHWSYPRCNACADVARRAQAEVVDRLLNDVFHSGRFSVSYGPATGKVIRKGLPVLAFEHSILVGPQGRMVLYNPLTKTFERALGRAQRHARRNNGKHDTFGKQLKAYLEPRFRRHFTSFVDGAVFSYSMGRICNATIATDSEFGARVSAYLDGALGQDTATSRWESPELSALPWLESLDSTGVVEVRREARRALPAFRALLRSRSFSDEAARSSLGHDLRAQADEVKHELQRLRTVKRRNSLLSVSGLLMGVYGFGTRDPATIAAGLGGFLSSLAAAHVSATEAELREHALLHKPAHLFMVARSVTESSSQKHRSRSREPPCVI